MTMGFSSTHGVAVELQSIAEFICNYKARLRLQDLLNPCFKWSAYPFKYSIQDKCNI